MLQSSYFNEKIVTGPMTKKTFTPNYSISFMFRQGLTYICISGSEATASDYLSVLSVNIALLELVPMTPHGRSVCTGCLKISCLNDS